MALNKTKVIAEKRILCPTDRRMDGWVCVGHAITAEGFIAFLHCAANKGTFADLGKVKQK